MDAHEIQALILYHCAAIKDAIDGGGIRPSKIGKLKATIKRLEELASELEKCPAETQQ